MITRFLMITSYSLRVTWREPVLPPSSQRNNCIKTCTNWTSSNSSSNSSEYTLTTRLRRSMKGKIVKTIWSITVMKSISINCKIRWCSTLYRMKGNSTNTTMRNSKTSIVIKCRNRMSKTIILRTTTTKSTMMKRKTSSQHL